MSLPRVLSPTSQGSGLKRPAEPEAATSEEKRCHLDAAPTPEGTEVVRRKRRKYALLLSYCGKGYLGMQRNPGYRTIEDDLLTAMLHADLMTEEGCTCPQMFHFQRAARTDKGVSAARQVVSVKLPEDVPVPEMVEKINRHLSNQIRVMAIRRATKGFNCKSWCDSRTYSYMCPTYAFATTKESTTDDYRITPEVLEKLRSVLKLYLGTHNFHNFTARKKAQDASAYRYIMEIDCGEPFERNGLQWVLIKIKGQSFMLHQIRKMVGLAMAITRGLVGAEVVSRAWREPRLDVPIAPGLGLVLEEPHYDKYNKRYGDDGIHEPLTWEDERQKIEEFREKFIDSTIIETEIRDNPILHWLSTLSLHHFSSSENTLPPKATPGPPRKGKGSDNEAEDEDEGDLDQYRVSSPEKKKETPAVVPGAETCREMTNGHSESTGEAIAKETISARTDSDEKVGEASSAAEVKCPNS
ncbi:pseudouridylate synthase 1 homolog [Eriocheir sinensis]|uniref:pseudouridylate synthase 1 homolog n=1 Tax=Eriocheir sinensis TaxID=95602 RepID=UPI0021C83734|nr:pseudouridylate synthase 1 homolog [Eriocheir sinensis]XP_050725240.1 pseudouridylate synthase 1 homolog [Eriocheir sinensis]